MKALFVHAHFDDYEFVAAGTFARWRRLLGPRFQSRVLICTDGQGGHHCRTREETGRLRLEEQRTSARIGDYDFALLRLPDGTVPRETCLARTPHFLAALWQAIRTFEPDYLFGPPLPGDPLAGVHIDHLELAEAIRKVAYLINVPHACTPEYPADETTSVFVKTPVILQVYDSYMGGANCFDLAFDVEEEFDLVCRMSYAHQSQIREWLPWIGRHQIAPPDSLEAWREAMRGRLQRRNQALGIPSSRAVEVFTVTAWGAVPALDQLLEDLPQPHREYSHLDRLAQRLAGWHGILE